MPHDDVTAGPVVPVAEPEAAPVTPPPATPADAPSDDGNEARGNLLSAPFPLFRRYQSDARFRVTRKAAEELLESLTAVGTAEESARGLRVLVVVAHPDDEAIGAGALLHSYRDAIVLHVTDGGGRDIGSALRHGFTTREAYARARRSEVLDALRLVGLNEDRIRSMGIHDGSASRQLVDVCRSLMDVIDELLPDVVLTHPYEGGHTDHDATAFAVHLACGILRREGADAPLVLELASYHLRNGERVRGDFLPNWRTPTRAVQLSPDGQVLKARMFDRFVSQRECLSEFPIDIERFRVAPRYLFTEPPHEGPLDYERHGVSITGTEWRAQAEKALEMLRARRRVRPRAD
jgi:LmbE family N-acetylglucosaminyl deacetylase